jgi:hypothetical protein
MSMSFRYLLILLLVTLLTACTSLSQYDRSTAVPDTLVRQDVTARAAPTAEPLIALTHLSLSPQGIPTASDTQTLPVTPSPQSLAVLAADERVALLRNRDSVSLRADRGSLSPQVVWFDDSRLLITWLDATASEYVLYLVDIEQHILRQLARGSTDYEIHTNTDRTAAMILWGNGVPASTLHASLLTLTTESLQPVFVSTPSEPQWTSERDHRWAFATSMSLLSGTWVDQHRFVLAVGPADYSLLPTSAPTGWGKLLLVDTLAQHVQVLSEQSQLLAMFPDGALMIRQGWIDQPLQILAPHIQQP